MERVPLQHSRLVELVGGLGDFDGGKAALVVEQAIACVAALLLDVHVVCDEFLCGRI